MTLLKEYVCDRCGAPKGEHALGEACNQNCGGHVIEIERPPETAAEALELSMLWATGKRSHTNMIGTTVGGSGERLKVIVEADAAEARKWAAVAEAMAAIEAALTPREVMQALRKPENGEAQHERLERAAATVLAAHGWRLGRDGLWRTDRFGGAYRTDSALLRDRA